MNDAVRKPLSRLAHPTRRAVVVGTAALGLAGLAGPARAQKITPEATSRKIELANDLYLLDARLLAEAGALRIGFEVENSRAILESARAEVNRHIELLLDGEPEIGIEREHSVAVQFVLSDLKDRWAVYGDDIHALAGHDTIPKDELLHVIEDSHAFSARVKELVDIIYEVYGEVIFSAEELRAVTLLSHERAHVEEMKEMMVFAATFPERKPEYMAELERLGGVFAQTIDVLIRNGAMFGVAPPPSPQALAALEQVEAHWAEKAALIATIANNGDVSHEELHAFFEASENVSEELRVAMAAFQHALLQS